jgi:hypothetical protein
MRPVNLPLLRLFFDTDALLAGSASTTGAAHVLLRLAELGLIEAVSCAYVRDEAIRNMERKLPKAGSILAALMERALTILPDVDPPGGEAIESVHPKNLPVWLAFQESGAHYLVTFNVRDYPPVEAVCSPGTVLARIRTALARLRTE